MRLSHLLSLLLLSVCPRGALAQVVPPPPMQIIHLVGGSTLIGQVTSTGAGKLHVTVAGLGEMEIDSASVLSRSPVPPPPRPPSPWSGTLTASMTHISTVVPGIAGATLGAQVTLGVVRMAPRTTIFVNGTMSYWHVEPNDPAVDQWALSVGGRHSLGGRWALLARTQVEVNEVQYLKYRSTTLGGLGYFFIKSARVSLLIAPGLGYGKSEQTPYGRILSFAAGVPAGVEGAVTGVHDMLSIQLTPMLGFSQDMHYIVSLGDPPFHQALFNAQLLGMMSPHFGLSIAYKHQYDSSMPPPVNKTLRSLVSGVQVKF